MDVPFVSSGALNRAHYTLVRNIESAQSPEIADSYILKEVESIRSRLRHPGVSLVRVNSRHPDVSFNGIGLERNQRMSHCPAILLHVYHISSPNWKSRFCFAAGCQFSRGREESSREADRSFPKFIWSDCGLNDAGGYLFCAEMMSPDHELRLMLVNTLRKV
jgi:AP-4 complex subunit epsilon-1